ncbi:hypothetical protein BGZ98_010251 [Dissophora globulifera]|nr:hypothetical protein BGZ98_010251 [Dissophora globulifera]
MSILTISHRKDVSTLKAIIVGGGIGGLAIAIMLELAGMEYEILERCTDEEEEIVFDEENRKMGRMEGFSAERYGYPYRIMTRPGFRQILINRVSKNNFHRGKTVVDTFQNPNGVSCKCSDGSTYYGDIIIGADGAQSLTRERMFRQLADQMKLSDTDMESSIYEHACLTGLTEPLDEKLYPSLADETSELKILYRKDSMCTLWYLPVTGNRIAWGLNRQLASPKYRFNEYTGAYCTPPTLLRREGAASNTSIPSAHSTHVMSSAASTISSGSRPQVSHTVSSSTSSSASSHSKIYDDWRAPAPDFEDFRELLDARCAMGVGTVRDFLSHTPRSQMSRIDLEERLYKTWYHGRMVLIGDACHPHLVVGGQGAVQCLLDGVCLVNLLYDMENNSPNEITKAFRRYHAKRSIVAKSSIDETNAMDKIFHGQGFFAGMMRRLLFNAAWSFDMANDKFNNHRPQLSFLPFVEDRATSKANKQKVSERLTRAAEAGYR